MHQFIVKVEGGKLIAVLPQQQSRLDKVIDYYEKNKKSIKVTFEIVSKDITVAQHSLFNAFVLKASEHFGVEYEECLTYLEHLYPKDIEGKIKSDYKSWKHSEMQIFIEKASAFLAEYGFKFN